MCLCSICSHGYIQHFLEQVLKLFSKYSWLMDSYILDFFVNGHWNSLPSSWQNTLLQVSPEDLGYWLQFNTQHRYKRVWPLSLIALKAAVSHLSIPRQAEHSQSHTEASDTSHCQHCRFVDLNVNENEKTLFSRYIKPKKLHEITKMAQVASSCSRKLGCQLVVDIGSGLGHLGRILALRHGLRVCCLEEQSNLIEKARKLDEKLLKLILKKKNELLVPPVHINMNIESTVYADDFMKIIKDAFKIPENTTFKFGIVGLHPCGNLGPTLLRLFVDIPEACFLNVVGCCYMKMDTSDGISSSATISYPLSSFTSSLDYKLSYEAREVACHAIENYSQRLRAGHVAELKVHCYRAVLESIIINQWPNLKHSGLRSIKHVNDMDFAVYATFAVERLGLKLPQILLQSKEIDEQLNQWMRVVGFYSLRLLVAPSIESTILLDRMLFLHENGIHNFLLPAFDPELSPRNHILIAMKN